MEDFSEPGEKVKYTLYTNVTLSMLNENKGSVETTISKTINSKQKESLEKRNTRTYTHGCCFQ